MATPRTPDAVLAELAAVPRRDDLARLVVTLLLSAADERRTRFSDGVAELTSSLSIAPNDADTPVGNVLAALRESDSDALTPESAVLLSALLARGIALSPPDSLATEARVVDALAWLAAHTPVDAFPALDAALGERAAHLWSAAGSLIQRIESGAAPPIGRAGAILVAAALRGSASPVAQRTAGSLRDHTRDPVIRALLQGSASTAGADLPEGASADTLLAEGEIVPAPRGPVAFVLLAFTGILALLHAARFFARWVLRYRRPAVLRVSPRGVTVSTKTELLGRTIREQEIVVPVGSLLRAAREVRFPRLALYAGLFALALGSYLGVSLFVDGARVGSPELLGMGALIVAIGVGLDFVLTSLLPPGRGRCRLVVVPRKGPAFAVAGVDVVSADAALRQLTRPS